MTRARNRTFHPVSATVSTLTVRPIIGTIKFVDKTNKNKHCFFSNPSTQAAVWFRQKMENNWGRGECFAPSHCGNFPWHVAYIVAWRVCRFEVVAKRWQSTSQCFDRRWSLEKFRRSLRISGAPQPPRVVIEFGLKYIIANRPKTTFNGWPVLAGLRLLTWTSQRSRSWRDDIHDFDVTKNEARKGQLSSDVLFPFSAATIAFGEMMCCARHNLCHLLHIGWASTISNRNIYTFQVVVFVPFTVPPLPIFFFLEIIKDCCQ